MKIVGATGLVGFWAYTRHKLTLRPRLRNLNLKSQFSIFDIFRDIRVHIYDFFKFAGGKVGEANFFFWVIR